MKLNIQKLITIFSKRTTILVIYLAQKLNFDEDSFLLEYLKTLHKNSFDILKEELKIKQNIYRFKKICKYDNTTISASEIENYSFCPIAFSISRTFDLPITPQAIIGKKLHSKQLLSTRKLLKSQSEQLINYYIKSNTKSTIHNFTKNEDTIAFLNELKESELIYPQQNIDEKDQKVFIGINNWFIGKPDYIFKNLRTGEHFVIEEKFHVKKDNANVFFENHLNQLRSYIFGINEIDLNIKYGYLVYWKFIYDTYEYSTPDGFYIESCESKKINKDEKEKKIFSEIYLNLKSTIKNKGGIFKEEYRNPVKCAMCVASLFCCHKTGKLKTFELPYSDSLFILNSPKFPDELNKKSRTETLIYNNETYLLYDRPFNEYLSFIPEVVNKVDINKSEIINYSANWIIEKDKLLLNQYSIDLLFGEKIIHISSVNNEKSDNKIFASFINCNLITHITRADLENSDFNTLNNPLCYMFIFDNGIHSEKSPKFLKPKK